MKKAFSLFLVLVITLPLCMMPVCADDGALSPALDVIASGYAVYKTGLSSHPLTFSPEDFEDALGTRRINSITILTLPDEASGTLYLSATPVMEGQVISRRSIEKLSFVPSSASETSAEFVFGTMSSSGAIALTCMMNLITDLNFAPTAAVPDDGYFAASTVAGIPLYARLDGSDPEGDAMIFSIVEYPQNGTLKMLDRSSGDYVYTPLDSFVGKDAFVYKIVDKCGNMSDEVTVSLNVESSKTDIVYCDLEGERAELAAVKLAEKGVFVGKMLGGKYYFEPSADISRAEFLALAMSALGSEMSAEQVGATSFADDAAIADCYRPFVLAAENKGWIDGIETSVGCFFMPAKAITVSEASLMCAKVMSLEYTDVVDTSSVAGEFLDADELCATKCMIEAGILDDDALSSAGETMTRADAAIMIYALMLKNADN